MIKKLSEHCFNDAEEQATQLAVAVAAQLRATIERKNGAVLAVSGGRSPIAFFQALSQQALSWEKVVITLVDERIIDTAHADSNTALVREYLLCNLAEKAQFHGLIADNLSQSELTDSTTLTAAANRQFIQADIIVLGMGEDAHTASLFPQVADLNAKSNIITVIPQTAPYGRLSLSLAAILKAGMIFLAIGGETKMTVYHQAKQLKNHPQPISYVLHQNSTKVAVYYYE